MKPFLFLVFFIPFFSFFPNAQTYRMTLGDELKFKKGTADLDMVAADGTGVYFTESHLRLKSYFVIGYTAATTYKLYKLDKNFQTVFEKEYWKELKGLDFHSFQQLENDLFLFATDYVKKEKAFKVYGVKIDKSTGNFIGDLAELGSYDQESKKDEFEMRISTTKDGKNFLLVSNISQKDHVSLGVSLFDKTLHKKESAVINISVDPDHYSLEDVKFTANDKIVVLGKEFEEVQLGKKKKKSLVFKQYSMSVYNNKGKKEGDIDLSSGDKFVIGGKLIESVSGDLMLAGFYSNASKKEDLSGFFFNKINLDSKSLSISSFKEISGSMLGKVVDDPADDNDDEIKKEKNALKKAQENNEDETLPGNYAIKSVYINPVDSSIIISAEINQFAKYVSSSSEYNDRTRSWTSRTVTRLLFTSKDILVVNADNNGKIKWINDIPKSQTEYSVSSSSSSFGSGVSFGADYDFTNYFATAGGLPYYTSFCSLLNGNNLIILTNDHQSNTTIPEFGGKVKSISAFRRTSSLFGIAIDLQTGKMAKKFIASNSDETTLMPRHALVVNNDVYLPSWRTHDLAKTQFRLAKVTVR